jgi:hypothetical protein
MHVNTRGGPRRITEAYVRELLASRVCTRNRLITDILHGSQLTIIVWTILNYYLVHQISGLIGMPKNSLEGNIYS